MTLSHRSRAGAALAAAAALVAGAGTASAQNSIPGDTNPGTTVVAGSAVATITVDAAAADATGVTGKVTNTSSSSLSCTGPTGNSPLAGTVTDATVVAASDDYYAAHSFKPDPNTKIDLASIPFVGKVSADIGLGGLLDFLPTTGSLAPMFGEAWAARAAITEGYTVAGQAGHNGTVPKFSVPAGGTTEWTSQLGRPSSGPRTDFQAGAFFICTSGNGALYRLAGYEGGTTPTGRPSAAGTGSLDTGSLGSAGAGSSGSGR